MTKPAQVTRILGALARKADTPRSQAPYAVPTNRSAWLSGWDWMDNHPPREIQMMEEEQVTVALADPDDET